MTLYEINMCDFPIDIVVTWLDSEDPNWLRDYHKYKPDSNPKKESRFRNWDIFRYWFRSIETNAPWVNKIYFVTWGHTPKWLNLNHPKLVIVKHSDYIPSEFLPTFNSRCIELNFGRISGLSEHFVYFNDDMFLNQPVTPEYYFRKGLPVDFNYERIFKGIVYNPEDKFGIELSLMCNIAVLNRSFKRTDTVKKAWWKWHGLHLTKQALKQSILMRGKNCFEGFVYRHTEQPFLKSIFNEIWEKEPEMLKQSCSRFRIAESLTPYFVRYWQFASNRFEPCKHHGQFQGYSIREDTIQKIRNAFDDKSIISLCLNDNPRCKDSIYAEALSLLKDAFEKKYPQKSSFEL